MILSDYEKRLQAVNPRLNIKKYGSSMAGVHYDKKYLCRVPQGDIFEHNVYEMKWGHADQYKTQFNPSGAYKFKLLTRRGRREAAQVIYTEGIKMGTRIISYNDIAKIV